jgi:hypothetical protein
LAFSTHASTTYPHPKQLFNHTQQTTLTIIKIKKFIKFIKIFVYKIFINKNILRNTTNITNNPEIRRFYKGRAQISKFIKIALRLGFPRKICNFEQSQNHPQPTHKISIDSGRDKYHKPYNWTFSTPKIDRF